MRPALLRTLGAVLVLGTALSGCTSFELSRLRNGLARDAGGAEVGPGYALSFGALSMGTARTALAIGDEGDEGTAAARALLRHVRRVQFGRYPVRGAFDGRLVETPAALRRYERRGWVPVVVVRDSSSATWIYAQERDADLRALLLVVFTPEELVLARVSGNLTAGVLAAAAEADIGLDRLTRRRADPPGREGAVTATAETP